MVLLLGDGDLGYAACVARELGSRLLATTLEASAGCLRTYGDARQHADEVRAAGGRVVFSVDALRLCDAASPLQAALAQLRPHQGTSKPQRRHEIGTVVMNFPVFRAPASGASGGVDGDADRAAALLSAAAEDAALEDEGELDWDELMDTNPRGNHATAASSIRGGGTGNDDDDDDDDEEDEESAAASDARRQQLGVAQLFKEVLGLVARGTAAPDVSLRLRLSNDQLSRWRVLKRRAGIPNWVIAFLAALDAVEAHPHGRR